VPHREGEPGILKKTFTVACAFCENYSPEKVEKALRGIVAACGGLPPLGHRVLLKPNLLSPRPPGDAVTTHPAIVEKTIELIKEKEPRSSVLIADNPGYIFTHQQDELFHRTGMTAIQEKGLAELSLLSAEGYTQVEPPQPGALQNARVASLWLSADPVINVAKLKTHVETELTASIKNTFGIADRNTRMAAHGARKKGHLAHAVVDLFRIRKPEFNILDAVLCMEGNGPSRGEPRFGGWLLASRNALALDAVAAFMMGYDDPFTVPILKEAARADTGPQRMADIEITGALLEDVRIPSFRRTTSAIGNIPDQLRGLGHRLLYLYPELIPKKCTSCGICKTVCPVHAIGMNPLPAIDRRKCVKCLCCHEMCPEGAMTVKENMFLKFFRKSKRTR
jgi:uncharacterized protein (DUF362 family)/Pyruvate/2-oxoacid:ferredoxin oxidoreductase delta subunit